ncbi:2-succinyl-5-enolpyruvyl-6-hydroxy-3-cyclohexene-1-carboxylic-acid synthase [Aquimarina sp. 2201CG5-10]|uniref:2-succinyl-5-enolpyruvyl-6-hydroxy-3- cyclohexene-1-carboxylic-acid synthase n=1 Tax=Aquimarina callyspongiae TaxID=3098150 RepID=UPI002AB39CCB|nr:2-succinyl-5-enolpyruvyl-6-hydroxy-3-cyclohexene-1-carboxylic-acid synthase [Aquimarina sp. 2201CG5-10]MDY8135669.1 2-succinyl-5-enolpyruvyl-6-hydroxy-3-cyclohexene-1-carboxylic-acid synthase [Aquimarina sp. 2201CG5-10]
MKKRLYSKIPLAQTIVALCEAKGVRHIVISPGSRNAPLIIGFTEHPNMKCYSIVDERCAAFFGLGIAQQTKEPVALVCTSGSALLNYYPAISEAYYSDIPLVVLSADRPIERIDIGDGQTIRQKNVFENHILYSANLYSEVVAETIIEDRKIQQKQREAQKHNEREINLALNKAIEKKGPVHINVPFYEPLYDKIESPTISPKNIPVEYPQHKVSDELHSEMLQEWNQAKRKLVLIGVNSPGVLDQQWITHFANDPSVLVLTETTSNIHHSSHINCIDQLISTLNNDEFESLQPDILLTFGGMIVSKRIKAFLRKYQPQSHWYIDAKKAFDTYFCLTEHIKLKPDTFFKGFLPDTQLVESNYKESWLSVREQRRLKHQKYLDQSSFTDLKAYEAIFDGIPDHQMIQLSNSSTVRYAQLFSLNSTFKVFCNRGTSGIDGSTSTAIGAALSSKISTTLITGDLSFFYDSNGLWNSYIPSNFKIILINNDGGGIFRILPGKEESGNFTKYFETTHGFSAEHLCAMYGFEYSQADTLEGVIKGVKKIYQKNDLPQLLEIFTPRKENDSALIGYFKHFV